MIVIISILMLYTVYIVTFKEDYTIKAEDKKEDTEESKEKKKELSGNELYEKILWSNVVLIVVLIVISVAFNV